MPAPEEHGNGTTTKKHHLNELVQNRRENGQKSEKNKMNGMAGQQ